MKRLVVFHLHCATIILLIEARQAKNIQKTMTAVATPAVAVVVAAV
jgi:hypothetical protein